MSSKSAAEQAIVIGFDRQPGQSDIDAIINEGGMRDAVSCQKMQANINPIMYNQILDAYKAQPGSFPPALVPEFQKQGKGIWAQNGYDTSETDTIAVMSFKSSDGSLFALIEYVKIGL